MQVHALSKGQTFNYHHHNQQLLSAKQRALLVQSLRKFDSFSKIMFVLFDFWKMGKRKRRVLCQLLVLELGCFLGFPCPEPSFLNNQTWVFDIGRKKFSLLVFYFLGFSYGLKFWGFSDVNFLLYLLIDRFFHDVSVLVIQQNQEEWVSARSSKSMTLVWNAILVFVLNAYSIFFIVY